MAWRTVENDAPRSPAREDTGAARPAAGMSQPLNAPAQQPKRQGASRFSPKSWLPRRGARSTGGDRMKRSPIAAAVKKFWIVLVVLAVVLVAGFCVNRLRGFFGAHDTRSASNGIAEDIKPFNPKHVVYEVYGPPGTVANINYLDINAQPRRVDNVPLPWTLSVTTTLPSVSVNVVAQGNSDEIGCRITVNDVVKDERSSDGVNAQTFCIVKSA
jgi:Mycobacterium membrane protein